MTPKSFHKHKKHPVCMGTGLLALDVIYKSDSVRPFVQLAGGSFGNVMSILSFLGWQSYPIARLGDDDAAKIILDDLNSFGVKDDYVQLDSSVSTPVIIERLYEDIDGQGSHTFAFSCPQCKGTLPSYSPVCLNSQNVQWEDLAGPKVFYFDRLSSSVLSLARCAKAEGALVIFEPSSVADKDLFLEAASITHVLKFSNERFRDKSHLIRLATSSLIVETLGKAGLRYRFGSSRKATNKWEFMPSFTVNKVRDAAGAGDWCSAGLIYCLAERSGKYQGRLTKRSIKKALAFGQAFSSISCQYAGARGAMYHLDRRAILTMAKGVARGKLIAYIPEGSFFNNYDRPIFSKCINC